MSAAFINGWQNMNETITQADMNFETILFQNGGDYFFSIYELLPLRLAVVLLSLFFAMALIPFMSSIVWEDWYNPGPKRFFTDRIISSIAASCVGYLTLALIPDILRYLIGPFSEIFCFFHYIIKNFFALQQLLLVEALLVARYIFIFWLKNPAAFQDEFWICYINMVVAGFSLLTQFTFAFLPGRQPMIFYFCCGSNPEVQQYQNKKFNVIMVFFQVATIILVVLINAKIRLYKRKHEHPGFVAYSLTPTWRNELNESLIFHAVMVFIAAEVTLVINIINSLNSEELNIYPNNMYVNIFQLVNPIVICGVGPLMYAWKNPHMNIIKQARLKLQRFLDCSN